MSDLYASGGAIHGKYDGDQTETEIQQAQKYQCLLLIEPRCQQTIMRLRCIGLIDRLGLKHSADDHNDIIENRYAQCEDRNE